MPSIDGAKAPSLASKRALPCSTETLIEVCLGYSCGYFCGWHARQDVQLRLQPPKASQFSAYLTVFDAQWDSWSGARSLQVAGRSRAKEGATGSSCGRSTIIITTTIIIIIIVVAIHATIITSSPPVRCQPNLAEAFDRLRHRVPGARCESLHHFEREGRHPRDNVRIIMLNE